MTDPRPYRAGLGLPKAIIIRSTPSFGASRIPPQIFDEEDSSSQNVINAYANREIRREETQSKEEIWKEWNINPTQHGPSKLLLPPKFVVSTREYDELGRSISDGVDVLVDQGKSKEGEKEREDGKSLADWYLSLARNSTPPVVGRGRVDRSPSVEIIDGPSVPIPNQKIEAVQDPDGPSITITDIKKPLIEDIKKPLRIHSKDWFIRRALLHSHSSDKTSSEPSKPIRTPSIGSLLNISPGNIPKRKVEPQYVLGPDNKGYEILKDRLGWEGGGLGRPVGWVDGQGIGSSLDLLDENNERVRKGKGKASSDPLEDKDEIIELDDNGNSVIDLTLSSSDSEEEEEEPTHGPGRTAPISTQLKLDRKGLGHFSTTRIESMKKKVTHTHKEIEDAKRRSKYGTGKHHGKGLELGKKGKIKWKEWEKREKEERRGIKAALG